MGEYEVVFGKELPELPSDIKYFRLEQPYYLYKNTGETWEIINENPIGGGYGV